MTIYQITSDRIQQLQTTTFAEAGLKERGDLQRLLRAQVEIISPDTLIIAEEFGEWEDSRRRIDLLGVDREANLVVIELKRTEDGGHMELQALRYAAMVSNMTFGKAVDIYADYLETRGETADAEQRLLEFLGWSEAEEESFAQDVHVVLASADFSKELTTAVMWLREYGLNITCMRLKPYRHAADQVLLDVQQVIPLPEAEQYQVQLREKKEREREKRVSGRDMTRYDL